MARIIYIILIFLAMPLFANSQSDWQIPEIEKQNICFTNFDKEFILEGSSLYENSCSNCHGIPGKTNLIIDVTRQEFHEQSDGEIFYKIKFGKDGMPGFKESYDDDEIWQIVAFLRSFNENYIQPKPNIDPLDMPKLSLKLEHDENVDKLVVKVFKDDTVSLAGVKVLANIKSMFGKYPLGETKTNNLGIAYFDIDDKLPGDKDGQLDIIVTAQKKYSTIKIQQKLKLVEPIVQISATEGKHLWSTRIDAPSWLQIIFHISVFGVWITILYVVFGLRKIKKYSK